MGKKRPSTVLDRLAEAAVAGDVFRIRKILYDCRSGLSNPDVSNALATSMTPDLETASNGLLSIIKFDKEKPLNFKAIGHSTEMIDAISSYIKATLSGDVFRLHAVVSVSNYELLYGVVKHIAFSQSIPVARCDAQLMLLSDQSVFDFQNFCKTIEGTGPAILVLEDVSSAIIHERKVEQFWRTVRLLPSNICVLYPFTTSIARLAEAYPHLSIYNSELASLKIPPLSKKDCVRLFEIRTFDFGGIIRDDTDKDDFYSRTYELYNCVISSGDLDSFVKQNDATLRPDSANSLFTSRISKQISLGYRICTLTKAYEDELNLYLQNNK